MALVGSGANSIPDVLSRGTWSSVDADKAFEAIAEQLGGVAWENGVPQLFAGNIDSTNFAAGIGLGSSVMTEPNSNWGVVLQSEANASAVGADGTYYTVASCDAHVWSCTFSAVVKTGAATASGSVTVYQNGQLRATIPVTVAQSVSVQYVAFSSRPSFKVKPGDVLSYSISGVLISGTPYHQAGTDIFGSPMVALSGSAGLVEV